MGSLVNGCACDNCNKEDEENNDESETESNNEEIDIKLNTLSRREIPKNIVDVKFKTGSLVKEYFGNPLIYMKN